MRKIVLVLLNVLCVSFPFVQLSFADAGGGAQVGQVPNQPTFLALMIQMLPLCIMIYLIFYFFVTRPQEQKNKKQAEMIGALKKGDNVRTSCGICGKVQSVEDQFIFIEIAQGVKVKFEKNVVIGKI